ncbi:MAG: PASTA domain-containing protein [Bacteroidaceae bacterium]|nr:PASTA domain-containing protein [Bacteroidaceae bacterium]
MKKKFSSFIKTLFINIAAVIVVLVALCWATLAWLDDYTLHGQVITVPDVCGLNVDEAAELLRKEKLDFEIADYKYKKGADIDDVIEQQPLRGSQVKEGRKIQLTLNSAKVPERPLPDVVDNSSLREAVARLTAAGFKISEFVKVSGELDWVYSVIMGNDTLQNGAKVPTGATLTLCIGNGSDVVDDGEPVMEESWFE